MLWQVVQLPRRPRRRAHQAWSGLGLRRSAQKQLEEGNSQPRGRPANQRFHLLCNEDGSGALGFGAFDGTPIPDRFLGVVDVPDTVTEIVLASDGYLGPSPTLAEAEAHVASLLREDPSCISLHVAEERLREAANWFDDRAYLRLRL